MQRIERQQAAEMKQDLEAQLNFLFLFILLLAGDPTPGAAVVCAAHRAPAGSRDEARPGGIAELLLFSKFSQVTPHQEQLWSVL